MQFRVVIIDEQRLFTVGLTKVLEDEFSVVGCFDRHAEGLSQLEQLKPDVVICDIVADDHLTEEIIDQISKHVPKYHFLVVTRSAEYPEVMQCLESGIRGFMLKSQPYEELFYALQKVCSGGVHYCGEAQEYQLHTFSQTASHRFGLTAREKEILQYLCQDQSPKEIAQRLRVDRKTVDTHKRNLFSKLGIKTMAQLTKFGLQNNLITL